MNALDGSVITQRSADLLYFDSGEEIEDFIADLRCAVDTLRFILKYSD
jgi:hypothetical protein